MLEPGRDGKVACEHDASKNKKLLGAHDVLNFEINFGLRIGDVRFIMSTVGVCNFNSWKSRAYLYSGLLACRHLDVSINDSVIEPCRSQ